MPVTNSPPEKIAGFVPAIQRMIGGPPRGLGVAKNDHPCPASLPTARGLSTASKNDAGERGGHSPPSLLSPPHPPLFPPARAMWGEEAQGFGCSRLSPLVPEVRSRRARTRLGEWVIPLGFLRRQYRGVLPGEAGGSARCRRLRRVTCAERFLLSAGRCTRDTFHSSCQSQPMSESILARHVERELKYQFRTQVSKTIRENYDELPNVSTC